MQKVIELKKGDLIRLNGKGEVMKINGLDKESVSSQPWWIKVCCVLGGFMFPLLMFSVHDDFIGVRGLSLQENLKVKFN